MPQYTRSALPPKVGKELFIDIETRSRQDLRKVSPYRYVEDPDFRILMAAWAVDDGPVQVYTDPADIMTIPGLWDTRVVKVAHNAAFERICFSAFFGLPVGRYLWPEQWHDTMAVAAEEGYPRKLEELAEALGGERKDSAGTHLINWFCKPDRNGEFRRPEDHPEKWAQFIEYARQDVVTHRDVHRRLGGYPTEMERLVYMADQRINDRGMQADMELARAATEAITDNAAAAMERMRELTGLDNPNSLDQLHGWLDEEGSPLPNLQAETVERYLAEEELKPSVREVLELRQGTALAASKKFPAALVAANSDGRLRGGFRFFGAHTGRWAGKGVQPHNLTRFQFDTEDETDAAIVDLKLGFGASPHDLKRLVRPLFTGPLTVVDYSAIEARVVAWLAGEQWALDAFAEGRDIYVETAERMSSPGRQFTRSEGKVAVLALGYNGGANSLRAMGAEGSEEALKRLVYQWRDTNPAIVELWHEMEDAFRLGGTVGAGLVTVERDGTDRALRLPSGRAINYHHVKHRWVDTEYGRRLQASFADPTKGNARVGTYGGRLTENITQAVARDVLGEALVRLDQTPHRVVGHVHDEVLVESSPTATVAEINRIATQSPTWAKGLPLAGAGFTCRRYRKD